MNTNQVIVYNSSNKQFLKSIGKDIFTERYTYTWCCNPDEATLVLEESFTRLEVTKLFPYLHFRPHNPVDTIASSSRSF